MANIALNRKLNTFDMTNLVIGSVVGADIYVITGIGARLLGPSSLLVWLLTGVLATIIALSFAYCVMMVPRAGGPYVYVKEASNPFLGFVVGWALLLSEWLAMAIFPVAFVQYFTALFPGVDWTGEVMLKVGFILIILVTNIAGVKTAGRFNDVLTLAKLTPLVLIMVGGLAFMLLNPATVAENLSPFFTGDALSFGQAMVLIMWAYAGFELSTLPADETISPQTTIPRAIILGMIVVMVFYVLTNLIVLGAVSQGVIVTTPAPLLESSRSVFAFTGQSVDVVVLLVGAGALISILGVDESGTLGTSRLAYAMAVDGLLPHWLSTLHPRFGTPYLMLVLLCTTALVASLVGGITSLINSTVFLLSFGSTWPPASRPSCCPGARRMTCGGTGSGCWYACWVPDRPSSSCPWWDPWRSPSPSCSSWRGCQCTRSSHPARPWGGRRRSTCRKDRWRRGPTGRARGSSRCPSPCCGVHTTVSRAWRRPSTWRRTARTDPPGAAERLHHTDLGGPGPIVKDAGDQGHGHDGHPGPGQRHDGLVAGLLGGDADERPDNYQAVGRCPASSPSPARRWRWPPPR